MKYGADKRKKKLTRSCRRLPHCRKLERLQKALVYVHMKEEKNVRFDRVAASACQSLSVPILKKKNEDPEPHLRKQMETYTHPPKNRKNIANCSISSAQQKA